MNRSDKKIYKSDDKIISGVVGGLAEYFGVNKTLFRLAVVFAVVATGIIPGVVTYIVAAIIMPHRPKKKKTREEASGSIS